MLGELSMIDKTIVSIIIPVFNKSEYTDRCIDKIIENTDDNYDFEIIIVDNNSTDNTQQIINAWQKKIDNLQYYKLDENLKFGYACNLGATNAEGEILVFLNNDTEPQPNWLRIAVDRLLSNDKIGIVGAKLLYPDNTIQHCGIDFFYNVNSDYKIWPLHRYVNMDSNDPIVNVAEEVPAVTGAALFIRKTLFFEIDKFDLKYKMYFEDTDLCFKVRAMGYKVFYDPKSVIIHHEGKSSPNQQEIDKLNKESAIRFYSKWESEINELESKIIIEERDEFFTIYSEKFLSKHLVIRNGDSVALNQEIFKAFLIQLLSLDKAYYHFGGVGDALLLLSTFYDRNPNQTIISFANSTKALKAFFTSFKKLKHVHIIPIPEDRVVNSSLRKLLPGFSNVLGMGVTPSDSFAAEWNQDINIFKDYGVIKNPLWCKSFSEEKIKIFQVVIAPMGSNFGMYKSKKNIINPNNWKDIIHFLTNQNIEPVIIGVPTEEKLFPILPGCINKRSYSFEEQMGIISQSDIFIGADSWGKTFAALAEIPTIVFQPMRGEDLKGWKDSSDYVFLNPWEYITVVNNVDEFYSTFSKIKEKGLEKKQIREKETEVSKYQFAENNIQVIWNAPIFDNSGYADESRNFVVGLFTKGVKLKLNPITWSNTNAELPSKMKKILENSRHTVLDFSQKIISVSHIFPAHFEKSEKLYNIGRTMFESDSLPKEWIEKCNEMDEIWVPSQFNIDSFANAGVQKKKLFKIHESLNTELFSNVLETIEEISIIKKFKFLSVFDWGLRKGWDKLLKAFIEEFREDESVLILKVWSSNGLSKFDINQEIKTFLKKELKILEIPSNIIFYDKMLPVSEYPKLYNSVDAYVSPNRGEGWGRPLMEAMAMGLPTIATRCTGQLEFMNDNNSYLIDCKLQQVSKEAVNEIPSMEGQNWYEPSLQHLKKLMRKVFTLSEDVKNCSNKGKQDIHENFNQKTIAKQIIDRLKIIQNENNKLKIVWEGDVDGKSSLSIVNNEILSNIKSSVEDIKILSENNNTDLESLIISYNQFENKAIEADIHIRHQFPPNLVAPKTGKWVIIQPWEFGSLPKKWVDVFSTQVDEMWVPSNYVKNVYIKSGVPVERVFVVPNGFNPQQFNNVKFNYSLKTKKKFKFLFVGGTIYRKGIDILLKAYTEQFSEKDDVCLVIKDMGANSFYDGQTYSEQIFEISKRNNTPEIEYINSFLSFDELKGLYQAADVLVHPYRGEGFGMPILESMACGTPVIVTNGGAALDFCNYENSFLVNAEKTYYKEKKVGELETVNHPWMYEVFVDDLKLKMQHVFENFSEINEKGKNAYNDVHANFSWQKTSKIVLDRLAYLANKNAVRFSVKDLFAQHIEKAFVCIERNEYLSAIENLEIAVQNFNISERKGYENLNLDELMVILGNIYFATSNLEKAKETLEAALNENPNSSQACQGLGEIFYSIEEFEAAKTMFEWAVKNDENNEESKQKLMAVNKKLGLDEFDFSLNEE